MKNTNVIELISNLGHIVSANDDVIKNCEILLKMYFTMEYQRKIMCATVQ